MMEPVQIHWIKAVSDDAPNETGEWLELDPPVEVPEKRPNWWMITTKLVKPQSPNGMHVVAFATEKQKPILGAD